MALVTPRTAATRLGVSYSTLKQWIHRGVVRTSTTTGGHMTPLTLSVSNKTTRLAPPRSRAHKPSVPSCPLVGTPASCPTACARAVRPARSSQRCTVLALR